MNISMSKPSDYIIKKLDKMPKLDNMPKLNNTPKLYDIVKKLDNKPKPDNKPKLDNKSKLDNERESDNMSKLGFYSKLDKKQKMIFFSVIICIVFFILYLIYSFVQLISGGVSDPVHTTTTYDSRDITDNNGRRSTVTKTVTANGITTTYS